jgi:hypothetical protein
MNHTRSEQGSEVNRGGGGGWWSGWQGWRDWTGWEWGQSADVEWDGSLDRSGGRWYTEATVEPAQVSRGPTADEPAVADGAAEVHEPAVADGAAEVLPPEIQPVYSLEHFRCYTWFRSGYKQHSAALKWFRDISEREAYMLWQPAKSAHPCVFGDDATAVAAIVHPKGTEYDFDREDMRLWNWQDLVAQLDAESMEYVVRGEDGRSRGVIGCECSIRPNSYDHKRHHALKQAGKPVQEELPIWDFVIFREDGTGVRLHPNWSNTKIECIAVQGHEVPQQPPGAGLGGSEGPGTFARYKAAGVTKTIRFDSRKA